MPTPTSTDLVIPSYEDMNSIQFDSQEETMDIQEIIGYQESINFQFNYYDDDLDLNGIELPESPLHFAESKLGNNIDFFSS